MSQHLEFQSGLKSICFVGKQDDGKSTVAHTTRHRTGEELEWQEWKHFCWVFQMPSWFKFCNLTSREVK